MADADEGHRFEGWEQALGRCRCVHIIIGIQKYLNIYNINISTYPRDLFGPQGRLMEIMSAEDQALAVTVIKQAEASFTLGDPALSYWWIGLQDQVLIIIILLIIIIIIIIISTS